MNFSEIPNKFKLSVNVKYNYHQESGTITLYEPRAKNGISVFHCYDTKRNKGSVYMTSGNDMNIDIVYSDKLAVFVSEYGYEVTTSDLKNSLLYEDDDESALLCMTGPYVCVLSDGVITTYEFTGKELIQKNIEAGYTRELKEIRRNSRIKNINFQATEQGKTMIVHCKDKMTIFDFSDGIVSFRRCLYIQVHRPILSQKGNKIVYWILENHKSAVFIYNINKMKTSKICEVPKWPIYFFHQFYRWLVVSNFKKTEFGKVYDTSLYNTSGKLLKSFTLSLMPICFKGNSNTLVLKRNGELKFVNIFMYERESLMFLLLSRSPRKTNFFSALPLKCFRLILNYSRLDVFFGMKNLFY